MTILRTGVVVALFLSQTVALAVPADAQPAARDPRLAQVVSSSEATTLVYANRPITELRARVLTYLPADRARAAIDVLDQIVNDNAVGPVGVSEVAGVVILRVGERDVLTLAPADVDELSGQTLRQKAEAARAALAVALAEANELRTPGRLLRASLRVFAATLGFIAALLLLRVAHRRFSRVVVTQTGRALGRVIPGETAREPAQLVSRFFGVAVSLGFLGIAALLTYWWLTFSLRQFPYTRPWGESLRARLLQILGQVGANVVAALPGLFIVLVIVTTTRLFVQVSNGFFTSIERGRLSVSWSHPDTAGATRRLLATILWLFALIVSYPYLPASESDAFKGVSVFVGLVISLGSSGIVNQLMSGLTLIYSRALAIGDIVRIGDDEGVVSAISLLSVKLRTFLGEEITLPNAVVVGRSTINYTKLAPAGSSYLATALTIGYDTPWRQVQGLLLLAAERTLNVRSDPPPRVIQDALEDFYVRYRLLVCLESPADRIGTRDRLHANIQDAFNEFGVQIMSPNYEADPTAPKIVPVNRWHEKPAVDSRAEAERR